LISIKRERERERPRLTVWVYAVSSHDQTQNAFNVKIVKKKICIYDSKCVIFYTYMNYERR
jgi:hypothetical protein